MVKRIRYEPRRGDAIWINLDPQMGREQMGRRPALILSPAIYNLKAELVLICPITSQIKGYPYEVAIPDGHAVTGAVLTDQVKSLDWRARNAVYITRLPDELLAEVFAKVITLLSGE